MTNVEQLTGRFSKIPRIEETGPKRGYNGKRTMKLVMRTRLIHTTLCILGLIPFVLKLCGVAISPRLLAVGFGLLAPGGGFIACAGPVTVLCGLYIGFFLWQKKGMLILNFNGSYLGLAGFWLLGALGGLLAGIPVFERIRLTQWWEWSGFVLVVLFAFAIFLPYELQTMKMYRLMKAAREDRIAAFDESISLYEAATAAPYQAGTQELDEEGIRAARFLLDATVNREDGDFSGFESARGLMGYRYQFSAFGYVLMVLHAKYLPNFTGYLKKAHRFLVTGYSDPRTCGYWARQALTGYYSRNPDPVIRANVMLSGWMMPVVAGYHDQYRDDEFEREDSIKFQPFSEKPEETYNYSSQGIIGVLYRQLKNKEYPYMLIPCEPHIAFPNCNSFALLGMLMYDRDHGTHNCEDFWDDLYDNVSQEFVEIDGSMALRRHYQFGVRHIPALLLGYNPLADVQNYMLYLPIFPGLSKRSYAQVRKHEVELRDGVAYLKRSPWEKIINMFTRKPDPSLQIALLQMTAVEHGDTELVEGLRKAEEINLARSKEPGSFKYRGASNMTTAYFAMTRILKKGYWSDVILRGMPETAFTGPLLADCSYPDVIPAKAASSGDDLDLVLYNGAEPGNQRIRIERLKPDTLYTVNMGEQTFTSDSKGQAELDVFLDGRTEVRIIPN